MVAGTAGHDGLVNEHIKTLAELESSTSSAHKRIDDHERRIQSVEACVSANARDTAVNTQSITNLCQKLDSLVTTLRWGIGILAVSALGLFVWLIQQQFLKP